MFEALQNSFASIDSVSVESCYRFLSKLDPDSRNATRCASSRSAKVAPTSAAIIAS